MKKISLLTLLTIHSEFLAVAQEATSPATVATTAPAKAKKPAVTNTASETITGKLGYSSDKKITVKAKGAEASTAFLVDAETKITINDEPKLISDLKKGSTVAVTPKAGNLATASLIVLKQAATTNSPTPSGTTQE
ncbi:MAG: hypothetical protein EBZ78_11395 [Verrucomicrobia bacterium]|nr:hypothetical protein [Verrucomicrobiota bacterium]